MKSLLNHKTALSLLFFFFYASTCISQTNNIKSIKLNALLVSILDKYPTRGRSFKLYAPALSYEVRNTKKGLHEFELSSLIVNSSDRYRQIHSELGITVRYQYSHRLFSVTNKLLLFTGVSLSNSVLKEKQRHLSPNNIDGDKLTIKNTFSFIPQLRYQPKGRLFLDISIPCDIFEYQFIKENPIHSITNFRIEEKLGSSTTWVPSILNMRMGIGVIL